MVEGCGGHSTLDSCLFGHQFMVCDCVVEESQFPVPSVLDTVGMVLVDYYWSAIANRTSILMTPRLQELRIRALAQGLDAVKKHMLSGNLGVACERLLSTYTELKTISRKRKL